MYATIEKLYPAFVSKHNSNREKEVILSMISNGDKWHYLAVKKVSAVLRGILPNICSGFYCLSCLHSFGTKNKFESHEKVYKNTDFCNIVMPSENTQILYHKRDGRRTFLKKHLFQW